MPSFSGLMVEPPWIKEIDINPLLGCPPRPQRLSALDVQVVLHGADGEADRLSRPAIRPDPTTSASRSTRRPARTTAAPVRANSSAVARPMPLVAPVTTTGDPRRIGAFMNTALFGK